MSNIVFYRNMISFNTTQAQACSTTLYQGNLIKNLKKRDECLKYNRMQFLCEKFNIIKLLNSKEDEFISKIAYEWLPECTARYPNQPCVLEGFFANTLTGVSHIVYFNFEDNVAQLEVVYVNTFTGKIDARGYIIGYSERVVARAFKDVGMQAAFTRCSVFKGMGNKFNVSTRSTMECLEKFTHLFLKHGYSKYSTEWLDLLGETPVDELREYAMHVGLINISNGEYVVDKDFDANTINKVPDFVKDLIIEKLELKNDN